MTHSDLEQLVALARRERPAPGTLAAVARSLRVPFVAVPLTAIVMPSTAIAGVVAKVGLSRLALLGWGAGGTVAVSGVALVVALSQPASPAPAAAPAPAPVVADVRPAPHASAPNAAEPQALPDEAAAASPAPRVVKEAPATWDEPQLIERARKALTSEPRRALLLTQEHQRRFPAGALRVERDVIALEALAHSGQTAEAKRRALAFEAKYPKSIHLPRVHALLARLSSR